MLMSLAGWTVPAIHNLPAALALSQLPAAVAVLAGLADLAERVEWARPRIRSYQPPVPAEPEPVEAT